MITHLEKTINKLRNTNAVLLTALEAAKEHLEYCNYGDSWERSCAIEAGLPNQIEIAIKRTKKEMGF